VVLEKEAMRRQLGAKTKVVTEGCRKMHYEELYT
jgi:hypothetical protein